MNRRGFTLIELLVAITVLVMIVTIVFVAFASVTDTSAIARTNTDRIHLQQYLWRHLNANLGAVYSDAGVEEPSFIFESTDEEGPFGPADGLKFSTALPLEGPQALPGLFKVVQYEVADPDSESMEGGDGRVVDDAALAEEGPRRVLRITEQPHVLGDFSAIEQSEEHIEMDEFDDYTQYAQVREIPIASFDLTFFNGDDWEDVWVSLDQGLLPWAVRVQANFPRTEEERSADMASGIDFTEESDLDLVILLPTGAGVLSPWVDLNHSRASGYDVPLDADGLPLDPGTGTDDVGEVDMEPGDSGGISGNSSFKGGAS